MVAGGGTAVPLEEAEALVWAHPSDRDGLARAVRDHADLRWVQLPWAGIEPYRDVIDEQRLWTCGKGVYAEPVAELALTLLLAGLRGGVRYARADRWTGQFGTSLFDGRVTIVGGGGIAEVAGPPARAVPGAGHSGPAPPRTDGPRRRGGGGRGPARGAARARTGWCSPSPWCPTRWA